MEPPICRIYNADDLHIRDIKLSEADVNLAQAAFNDVVEDLEGSKIFSPFDGLISLINVELDDEVNDESRVVEVIDPSVAEVVGVIDAANRGFIRIGSTATVTIKAIEGRSFNGSVTSIASEPSTERGVISYSITINVEIPNGTQVSIELTGVTTVILGDESGVIMVPDDSFASNEAGQTYVNVMRDGALFEQTVLVGESQDGWKVVYAGLRQGDQVVVTSNELTALQGGTGSTGNIGAP